MLNIIWDILVIVKELDSSSPAELRWLNYPKIVCPVNRGLREKLSYGFHQFDHEFFVNGLWYARMQFCRREEFFGVKEPVDAALFVFGQRNQIRVPLIVVIKVDFTKQHVGKHC